MNKILELSSKSSKGGRRKIKMVLLTIHNEGEKNLNNISWKEEYVLNNLESAKGIPICASFINTEDKEIPFDHGYTETVEVGDGKSEPLFNNSECCGVIEDVKIEDLEIDGKMKRVLVGYGVLFYQRYKNFCDYIKKNILLSEVKSSIEIVGKDGGAIVYDGGYNEEIRYPQIFDFSATAILGSVKEADENCYVLEVAQKKENKEEKNLNEKELKDLIQSTILETNSKTEELNKKITELNSTISEKDSVIAGKDEKISELNATVEQIQKALDDLKKENETYWAEREALEEALERELGELKAKARLDELNTAIEGFSDEEKKFAESEINSFNENPLEGNIDDIVSKIYAGIGRGYKENEENNRTSECNSSKDDLDIFAEINSVEDNDDDNNIF